MYLILTLTRSPVLSIGHSVVLLLVTSSVFVVGVFRKAMSEKCDISKEDMGLDIVLRHIGADRFRMVLIHDDVGIAPKEVVKVFISVLSCRNGIFMAF